MLPAFGTDLSVAGRGVAGTMNAVGSHPSGPAGKWRAYSKTLAPKYANGIRFYAVEGVTE